MSTYGNIRRRLVALFPGFSLDLIEGFITDRYIQILDRLDWQRREVQSVLATAAPYTTGTAGVTNGSASITGTGTWTAAMTGRSIRIAARQEFYKFTQTGAGTGTLDRAYEGETDADATYRIFQSAYSLPSDCKILGSLRSFQDRYLEQVSLEELNRMDPGRSTYGDPQNYALTMEDSSDPPRMQVELWPAPDKAVGLPLVYTAEAPSLTAASVTILPWVRDHALIKGVTADVLDHLKDYPGADRAEAKFESAVNDMIRTECLNRGPVRLQMADRYTDHRLNRRFR